MKTESKHARRLRVPVIVALCVAAAAALAPTASAADGRDSKIWGGADDTRTDVPFVGAVLRKTGGSQFARQFCGGTLISPRHFVTAAHCLYDGDPNDFDYSISPRASQVQLFFGKQLADPPGVPGSGGVVANVASIRQHPNFNDNPLLQNDVSVLTLSAPVAIPPARLLTAAQQGLVNPGAQTLALGWGDTVPSDGQKFPTRLQSAIVPVAPSSTCAVSRGYNPNIMLCGGRPGSPPDTCKGDSGGPFLAPTGNAADPWRLAGITSGGLCGQTNAPGYYTRINAPAITSFIAKAVNPSLARPRVNRLTRRTSSGKLILVAFTTDATKVRFTIRYRTRSGARRTVIRTGPVAAGSAGVIVSIPGGSTRPVVTTKAIF